MPSDTASNASSSPGPASGSGTAGSSDDAAEVAALARSLVRTAWKGGLATISRSGGHPYASLVACATDADGTPLLLLSGLAEHTRNLLADPRASLLVDATPPGAAAVTGARVTLVGTLVTSTGPRARQRYLSRHPDAAQFVDFADFALYRLDVEWAHLVAGFGRIRRLHRDDVVLALAGAETVVEAEPDIVRHMNEDHTDAIAALAERAADRAPYDDAATRGRDSGGQPRQWRMLGCDPEGMDLAAGDLARRVAFPHRVNSPEEVRTALVGMIRKVRATG